VGKANRRLRKPSSHSRLFSRVAIWDVAWGGASPLAAFLLRDGTLYSPNVVAAYCGIALLASFLIFQWFQTGSPISRFYSIRDALELLKACALVAAFSAVLLFLISRLDEAPRSIPILHFLLLVSGLLGVRMLARMIGGPGDPRRLGSDKPVRHVLIIQASRLAWLFSKMVEELAPGAFQIVAVLDERPQMKHRSLNGYPIVGTPADLDQVIADYAMHGVKVDQVIVAARPDELAGTTWDDVARICRARHISAEILPQRLLSAESANTDDGELVSSAIGAERANVEPSLPLLLDRPFWTVKRAVDFMAALAVAILTLPVAVMVCALVLIDVGIPIVFWQQRVGRNGAPLYLYKFRTLQAPFDRRKRQPREAPPPSAIGRFLRATRLDELPQIWNILSGDMSVVGPRPLLAVDQPANAATRLSVRPGLTGWAQICGGRLITPEEKSALDEWYIRHASLKLDAVIVLRTIRMLLVSDHRDETAIATALNGDGDDLLDPRHADAPGAEDHGAAGFAEVPAKSDTDAQRVASV
jgi:lipopolysaccharide/colanic/teichoic acid biosynthesis glycosyltransferase